ncbi:glycoside hydrolase family 3 C-terminal domain-containing protein [Novacetimonas hansenii]|uniref:Glycoside hydrolase family 3 C-terminal domain-containing protein n=1 Tax=Novacetimonas hansenii TaxID=436 RepID=A0AAW5ESF5_NOVHA|nr:glycoside hydrolase family 3 C-terminal domain-containing protein [Novacetimonas hansenii]
MRHISRGLQAIHTQIRAAPRTMAVAVAAAMVPVFVPVPGPAPSAWAAAAPSSSAQTRAADMVARMRPEEKLSVLRAFPAPLGGAMAGEGTGLLTWPGVPRLGLPALRMGSFSDPHPTDPTMPHLPFLALAASWDPVLAHRAGMVRARDEWGRGRAMVRVGGVDLLPSGRLQAGEDPMLAGTMAGMVASGLMVGHVVPVFASLRAEEQGRGDGVVALPATLPVPADQYMGTSLMGLSIALGTAHGGAIACGGMHVCGALSGLSGIMREQWHFGGMLMAMPGALSGADASPVAAVADGVDMEQSPGVEDGVYAAPLRRAVATGAVQPPRIDQMAQHVLTSLYGTGILDHPPPFTRDRKSPPGSGPMSVDGLMAEVGAEGMVLLQNENQVLPLDDRSGQVLLLATQALQGPLVALAAALQHDGVKVSQAVVNPDGTPPPQAAQAARIVMLTDRDADNAFITALADLGGHVVTIMMSDSPDRAMPWLDVVDSVIQAWSWHGEYAAPLAAMLTGTREFSGRLPMTFTGGLYPPGMAYADYNAFERAHIAPLFPFGYGLSVAGGVSYGDVHVSREDATHLSATFTVTDTSDHPIRAVAQLYLTPPVEAGGVKRLVGWRSIALTPGHATRVAIPVDPHLLGQWDTGAGGWVVPAGTYTFAVGASSVMLTHQASVRMPALHVSATLENLPVPTSQGE